MQISYWLIRFFSFYFSFHQPSHVLPLYFYTQYFNPQPSVASASSALSGFWVPLSPFSRARLSITLRPETMSQCLLNDTTAAFTLLPDYFACVMTKEKKLTIFFFISTTPIFLFYTLLFFLSLHPACCCLSIFLLTFSNIFFYFHPRRDKYSVS